MKLDQTKLSNEINRVSTEWETSGSVMVFKDGQSIHKGFYGKDIDETTRYVLHSKSPFLVGMAALLLMDQGKLKLSDSLAKFIPEYKHSRKIRVKHLFKGNSGIPDFYYNHLMVQLDREESENNLSTHERRRLEHQIFNENRSFEKVFDIVKDQELLFEPGISDNRDSTSNWEFLAEIIKRITWMPLSEFLTEFLFKPLEMNQVKYGYDSQVVSQTEIKETELVDMPMDYSVEGVFSVTFEDMGKLLKAIGSRKVISEKLWHQALKYDSNGTGLIFENANGFDCGNITFLGFGFFFYFNHKTGLAYGSLVTAQQKFKNINGDWHYYRRCLREVIEAAFTFPADTKLVKLDKKNMWQALTLKVEPDQEGFVLEAKSSVAMALMYKTKHAYVEMEGNRVVGLLVLEMDKRKNYYNIDIILIDRKYQGRGYGKIMLQWAVDKLTQEGAKELEIGVNRFNHAAKKIYLDIGFQPKAVYDGGMTLRMKL